MALRSFTLTELAQYDGTGGNPAYVAYNGKVYDLSESKSWTEGQHYQHPAGEDLTQAMQDAPHGGELMDEFPVVGEIVM